MSIAASWIQDSNPKKNRTWGVRCDSVDIPVDKPSVRCSATLNYNGIEKIERIILDRSVCSWSGDQPIETSCPNHGSLVPKHPWSIHIADGHHRVTAVTGVSFDLSSLTQLLV
jgi:hypothetical protein